MNAETIVSIIRLVCAAGIFVCACMTGREAWLMHKDRRS